MWYELGSDIRNKDASRRDVGPCYQVAHLAHEGLVKFQVFLELIQNKKEAAGGVIESTKFRTCHTKL